MPEETPQLPVSEQEVQIEAPSLLDKFKAQKKKIFIGLGSFLGVLMLAGVVFGVYKLGQRQVSPPPAGGPTPTPEVATPTPDPTTNWQTYTDEEYKYSLKYPTGPEFQQTKCGNDFIFNIRGDSSYDEISCDGRDAYFSIELRAEKGEIFSEEEYPKTTPIIKVSAEDFVISGAEGKKFTLVRVVPAPVPDKSYEILFYKNGIRYRIIFIAFNHEDIFNLILSTFKFLGEENCVKTDTGESMTLTEAKEIALASKCVEEGGLKETYSCNNFTGTWWLDLEIDKPGCAPACVVNVVTKEAEINWRCTGLIPSE